MALSWNGVTFHETPLVEGGPDFSYLPMQESRYTMRGWFDWADTAGDAAAGAASAAGMAFAGWCRVAGGYVPLDQGGNPQPQLGPPDFARAPDGLTYFNYTNPFAHPDHPNQMFLCEGLGQVRGYTPNKPSIGPNSTATFEEAWCSLHFRSPKNGYRVLPDLQALDLVSPPDGHPCWIPREYFCTRNMEIVEEVRSRAQTVPALAGLRWQVTAGPAGIALSSTQFINLQEGEITLTWYPVPINGYNEPAALDLIGKCNDAEFPPRQPAIPGVPAPPLSLMTRRGLGGGAVGKSLATLVWGQPKKEIIRMGDCGWAYKITFRMSWYPFGANAFFWHDPPPAVRGRIRIDPVTGPTPDNTLGGPGYYPTAYPGGGVLFPNQDFRKPFLPQGQAV